jgi:methionyl-tRNA formyltransferase
MGRKIIFMGTPDFAVPAFEAVRAAHNIVAVYTRPPAKQGRGQHIKASPVQAAAQAAGIQVLTPSSLKAEDELARFRALAPELAIVVAYGMILPQDWLDVPQMGCWNIHASLLPRWRGAAPVQRAIMAGDRQTGVAVMQMQAGLDTGDVLMEKRIAIAADDNAQSLHDKLAKLGGVAIAKALAADKLTPVPQATDGITYAEKIDKAEARLDFTRPANELDAHIRGLSPFPGAWFEANGKRIKVLAAKAVKAQGAVAQVAENGAMVFCGQDALQLLRVQPAGKAAMSGDEFMRGRGLMAGEKLD